MNIKVKEGSVHVNDIWVLAEHDDVIVLQADLKEKRADIWGYGTSSVILGVQGTNEWTEVHIKDVNFKGVVFAEISKHTLTITLVKFVNGRKVWSNEDR